MHINKKRMPTFAISIQQSTGGQPEQLSQKNKKASKLESKK